MGTYLVGHPDDALRSMVWRQAIYRWLAEVGTAVYKEVDFRLGLIGWEASGQVYAADIVDAPRRPRGFGYLVPDGQGVRYLPAEV